MQITKKITTLNGSNNNIEYRLDNGIYIIKWGITPVQFSSQTIDRIMHELFEDDMKWVPLGANFSNPTPGSLGEYIYKNKIYYSPKFASLIAAVMVEEDFLIYKRTRGFWLRRA